MSTEYYATLEFTNTFLATFAGKVFTVADRDVILKALHLLDTNEHHPSLRVHKLSGDLDTIWSVSASTKIRLTFLRLTNGRKRLLTCSQHYND